MLQFPHGHYGRDSPRKKETPISNQRYNYRRRIDDIIGGDDRRRVDDRRRGDEIRRRDTPDDYEQGYHPQKKERNYMYQNYATTSQPKYIIISALRSSSPMNLYDSWLVYSGDSGHFYRYN